MAESENPTRAADALQEAIQAIYRVEHGYNHAIMHAEMANTWPLMLDRATALQQRAALTRAMNLLTLEVMPALDPTKKV